MFYCIILARHLSWFLYGILKFDVLDRQAAHTVLINNDPIYTRHFSSLNNKQEERVLALNMDVGQAIDILISKQNESGLAKRNLVVGLRIDHRKIPNVGDFLQIGRASCRERV